MHLRLGWWESYSSFLTAPCPLLVSHCFSSAPHLALPYSFSLSGYLVPRVWTIFSFWYHLNLSFWILLWSCSAFYFLLVWSTQWSWAFPDGLLLKCLITFWAFLDFVFSVFSVLFRPLTPSCKVVKDWHQSWFSAVVESPLYLSKCKICIFCCLSSLISLLHGLFYHHFLIFFWLLHFSLL